MMTINLFKGNKDSSLENKTDIFEEVKKDLLYILVRSDSLDISSQCLMYLEELDTDGKYLLEVFANSNIASIRKKSLRFYLIARAKNIYSKSHVNEVLLKKTLSEMSIRFAVPLIEVLKDIDYKLPHDAVMVVLKSLEEYPIFQESAIDSILENPEEYSFSTDLSKYIANSFEVDKNHFEMCKIIQDDSNKYSSFFKKCLVEKLDRDVLPSTLKDIALNHKHSCCRLAALKKLDLEKDANIFFRSFLKEKEVLNRFYIMDRITVEDVWKSTIGKCRYIELALIGKLDESVAVRTKANDLIMQAMIKRARCEDRLNTLKITEFDSEYKKRLFTAMQY